MVSLHRRVGHCSWGVAVLQSVSGCGVGIGGVVLFQSVVLMLMMMLLFGLLLSLAKCQGVDGFLDADEGGGVSPHIVEDEVPQVTVHFCVSLIVAGVATIVNYVVE